MPLSRSSTKDIPAHRKHAYASDALGLAKRSSAALGCRALVSIVRTSLSAENKTPTMDDIKDLLRAVVADESAPADDRDKAKKLLKAISEEEAVDAATGDGDEDKNKKKKDGAKGPDPDPDLERVYEKKDDAKARLTGEERELLERSAPGRRRHVSSRAESSGSMLQMPSKILSSDEARARLAEMDREAGR